MSAARPGRIDSIDAARGLALAGMVVFHAAWDFHFFGLTGLDPSVADGWLFFGHAVACCFLFLSGFGLVLAHERGATLVAALRRLSVVAGAAAALTLVTALAMPAAPIRFGILHCIALSNLLALPLLRLRPIAVAAIAATALAVPALVVPLKLPGFWWWLGLSGHIPDTLDARPLLPWAAAVFLGVIFGQLGGARLCRRTGNTPGTIVRLSAAAGRHSLVIYLAHQPVMFGVLLVLAGTPVEPSVLLQSSAARQFSTRCLAECGLTKAHDQCVAMCGCVRSMIGDAALASPQSTETLADTVRLCLANPEGGVAPPP